mgnify:CR=1 FL=1
MFEEFYEMYESEEQEVVALINRCIGGGFNWKGNFWEMTVVTLGIVSCDTGKVSTKEERLDWPVTDEERHSDKGWDASKRADLPPEDSPDERRMGKDLVVQPGVSPRWSRPTRTARNSRPFWTSTTSQW